MKSLEELINDYLKEAKLLQIATAIDNKPWVASVWYASDDKNNLYFESRRTRRHSVEIKANASVAGTIVMPHTEGRGQKVRGIQFSGQASEVQPDDMNRVKTLYRTKYPLTPDTPIKDLIDPSGVATFYIIKPDLIVLFDEINFPDNPRQEFRPFQTSF